MMGVIWGNSADEDAQAEVEGDDDQDDEEDARAVFSYFMSDALLSYFMSDSLLGSCLILYVRRSLPSARFSPFSLFCLVAVGKPK